MEPTTDTKTDPQSPGAAPATRGPSASHELVSPFAMDALAIGSSLGTACITVWSVMQRDVYKNLSSLGMFDDMKPKRKTVLHQIESNPLLTSRQSYHLVDDLIDMNDAEALQRMRKVGINTMVDRWHLLRYHQKVEAVMWGVAAGSVALGAMLPILRDMVLHPGVERKSSDADKSLSI